MSNHVTSQLIKRYLLHLTIRLISYEMRLEIFPVDVGSIKSLYESRGAVHLHRCYLQNDFYFRYLLSIKTMTLLLIHRDFIVSRILYAYGG
jgi:hypothetical protein